jgi:hypothetical protein
MKMKKIIAIILAGGGILSAGATETRADSFVVEQGFYQSSAFSQQATFSGDDFAVNYNLAGGIFGGSAREMFYETGIFVAGFGRWTPPPAVPNVFFAGGPGTIQVGNVSCQLPFPIPAPPGTPDCGGFLTFSNQPMGLPPIGSMFTGEAPFTMTGQLVVSQMGGLPNLIVDIEGSGIVQAEEIGMPSVRYEFAAVSVPEPSTVVLLLSGLVAVGGRRWRGGKRPVSRRRGLADSF